MKHKIFLFSIIALVAVGSGVLANYVEPSGTAPNNNTTSAILKTGPDTPVRTYEKIGTGNGTSGPNTQLLTYGPFANMGLYTDKFLNFGTSTISENLIVKANTEYSNIFDQYVSTFKYTDPNTQVQNINAKPLEAFIAGRFFSKLLITGTSEDYNPKYDLELRATSTFTPTTNFGLGNSCNLYPSNLGIGVTPYYNDATGKTGCRGPFNAVSNNSISEYDMAYVSSYKAPSFSGTPTASNNTNNQVVGTCTFFNPSASPTNIGGCYGSPGMVITGASRTISQNPCVTHIQLSANHTKNPKISVVYVSGLATPDHSVSPTAIDNMSFTINNPTSNDCNGSAFWAGSVYKWVVTDDYGQYFEQNL